MCIASSASGRSVIGAAKLMMIGLATPTAAPLLGLTVGGLNGGAPVKGSGFCSVGVPHGMMATDGGVVSTASADWSIGDAPNGSTVSAGGGPVGEETSTSESASTGGFTPTMAARTVNAPSTAVR